MVRLSHCSVYLSQVISMGRFFYVFVIPSQNIGIIVFIDINQAIRSEINWIGTGCKTAIVFIWVHNLNGQSFPTSR